MSIVKWNFPTFEEWNKNNKKYEGTIGDYNCHIRVFSFGDGEADYMCAISTSINPLNIYSDTIVKYCKTVNSDNESMLRNWYEKIIDEVQIVWVKYINDTYIEKRFDRKD